MRYKILFSAFIATLLFACTSNPFKTTKKRLIVLIDLSSSIDSIVLNEYYEKIFFVVKALGKHDALTVYPVDGGSITSFKPILEFDFYKCKHLFEVQGLNKAQTNELEKVAFTKFCDSIMLVLKQNIKALDRSILANNTDIIGALAEVSKDIEANKNVYTNQSVLLLSDMEQFSDKGVKFLKKADIANWTAQAPKEQLLIKNLPIAVITGSQTKMDSKTYQKIEAFWRSFFTNQQVKLITYNSSQNNNLLQLFVTNN